MKDVAWSIEEGLVTAVHGASGDIASDVSYDFLFVNIQTNEINYATNIVPRRSVPDSMEISQVAEPGARASRSVWNGTTRVVLWDGEEQYAIEECPE